MPNITNVLTAIITSTDDVTGNVPINIGTGNPTYDCSSVEYQRYFLLTGGVQAFALPKSPATIVYINNLSAANYITVTWTPSGGASSAIIVLNAGDQIILFGNPAGATTPGITALSMQSSAAGSPVEFLLAG
jgi:hypothetical protein